MTQHSPVASFFLEIKKYIGPRYRPNPGEYDPAHFSSLVFSRNPNIIPIAVN